MKKTIFLILLNLTLHTILKSQCTNPTFPTIGSNTTTICAGGSVTFTRTGTSSIGGFTGYEWVYNSGSSTSCASATFFSNISNPAPNNVTWTFPTPGVYTVRLRAIANSGPCLTFWPSGYCSPQSITINVLGAPTFTMGSPVRYFCPGFTAALSPTVGGGATVFQWQKNNVAIPGATLATLNFPAVTATDAGVYRLVATSSCGTATSSAITFTTLSPSSITGNTNVLTGSVTNYSTIAATGLSAHQFAPLTYTWSQNGTSTITSGVNSNTISVAAPSSPSIYTINLASSFTGMTCTAISTLAVNAVSCFSINPVVGSQQSFNCTGQPLVFYNQIIPTGTVVATYSWTGPNSFTTPVITTSSLNINNTLTVTPNATMQNAGTYTVTINNGGCITTGTVTPNIVASPNLVASTSSPTICTGSSATLNVSGANSYTWSPSVPLNWVVSPNTTTTYTIVGTGSAQCTSSVTLTQNVVVCTGMEDFIADDDNFRIYPNPTQGHSKIEFNDIHPYQSFKIVNILGHEVLNQDVYKNQIEIDLSHYPDGIYFIQLLDKGKNIKVRKLIKF